jgi:hypothetical protein
MIGEPATWSLYDSRGLHGPSFKKLPPAANSILVIGYFSPRFASIPITYTFLRLLTVCLWLYKRRTAWERLSSSRIDRGDCAWRVVWARLDDTIVLGHAKNETCHISMQSLQGPLLFLGLSPDETDNFHLIGAFLQPNCELEQKRQY